MQKINICIFIYIYIRLNGVAAGRMDLEQRQERKWSKLTATYLSQGSQQRPCQNKVKLINRN